MVLHSLMNWTSWRWPAIARYRVVLGWSEILKIQLETVAIGVLYIGAHLDAHLMGSGPVVKICAKGHVAISIDGA